MEKSNRTIKAIHNYMDVVNNWLDDTDGKLDKVDSSKNELRNATLSPLAVSGEHSVDGVPEKGPEDEAKEGDEQAAEKTEEDTEGPKKLSEDEREQLQYSIEQIEIDIKVCD